jgi:hypothetical protein
MQRPHRAERAPADGRGGSEVANLRFLLGRAAVERPRRGMSTGSSAQIDPMTLARMKTVSAQAMIQAVATMTSRRS